MLCLTETSSGVFEVANPQPELINSCTYVIAQPTELQNELFNISLEGWQQISVALAGVLVMGFTFRAIAQALNTNDGEIES